MPNDIIKQIKSFYKLDQASIVVLLKKVCTDIIFIDFPEFKKNVSILVVGSTASGYYDKRSDLDLSFIFHSEIDFNKYKGLICDKYKGPSSVFYTTPIEIHGMSIRSIKLVKEDLSNYSVDWRMAEYASALVLNDPQRRFAKLVKNYRWYPIEVYREKLNYLFAEINFQLFDRYLSALKRKDNFHAETVKLKIIKNLVNATLLANKRFPANDKHLLTALSRLGQSSTIEQRAVQQLLKSANAEKKYKLLLGFYRVVENKLVKARLIPQKEQKYWIDLRPKYKIDVGS